MKKTTSILFLIITTLLAAAPMDFRNLSVASTDNFFAGFINPAGLGVHSNSSFTFMKKYVNEDFKSDYSLLLKQEGFEYILESNDGTQQTLALGYRLGDSALLRNSYIGHSYRWRSGSLDNGDLQTAFLQRPSDYVSLGYVLSHPDKMRPQHRAGIALKPIVSGKFADLIELSADAGWGNRNESQSRGFIKPTVGFNINLANSFGVGGSYNIDDETVGLKFSLNGFNMSSGSIFNAKNDDIDGSENSGYAYVSINEKFVNNLGLSSSKKFLNLGINNGIVDENTKMHVGPITIKLNEQTTMLHLLEKIERATNDVEIGGIIFMNNNFAASFAKRQELLTALHKFKNEGKSVVFYYENISNANYAFAANIADAIYLNPEGMVSLNGLGSSSPYVKNMLDKLGIDFYNFRSHPFKTAGNMFSETGMTDQERVVLERLYGDIYEEMVKMIREGRGNKLSADVKTIIDNGPYFNPEDALENGLVDQLVEWHELDSVLEKNFETSQVTRSMHDFMDYEWHKPGISKIAIIYASGSIISGKGQAGKTIGSETTSAAIRAARLNPQIEGIILRVDSGGGSALASHVIAEEIRLCTEGENKKPIIALMSGVAASGGYYISTHADQIIAEPTTITGSIGVIGMMPNFNKLSKRVGVNWSEVKFGKNSTFGSLTREMTDNEKEMFKNFIHSAYTRFVTTVADSRNKSFEETNKVAMGQVWTGNQAFELGLVDKLGGFELAISEMRNMIDTENEFKFVEMSSSKNSMFEISVSSASSPLFSITSNPIFKRLVAMQKQIDDLSSEKILYSTPYSFDELSE